MKKILAISLLILSTMLTASAKKDIAQPDRYVVVVSLDGCRWDYPYWYDTPFFDQMAKEGVESGLIPSFPSKTFPNHYTLATGLVPDHHGIIHNTFRERTTGRRFSLSNLDTKLDPTFWGGEPIWLTTKHNGVRTAVFYWPGSDIAINGEYPDVYYQYDKEPRLTVPERFKGVIKQLQLPESQRPHFIMAYSEEPDGCGHKYGPQGIETRASVQEMDSLLNILYHKMMQLPIADKIDFIVLSDHGMAMAMPEQTIYPSTYIKKEWYTNIEGSNPTLIYAKEGCTDSIYNALQGILHLSVWKKGEVPAELHYGTDKNAPDIIASTDLGWMFQDKQATWGAGHGWDPGYNEMHAMFRAVGPDFKHIKHPHFRNVNIYPLICHLLNITPSPNDGTLDDIKDILQGE